MGILSNVLSGDINAIITLLYQIPAVLIALTLHEVAHGYMAMKCGDPTAQMLGRLSLNPLHHLDPIGTVCMFLFGIGWAKPVPINPLNFENPKKGMMISSLAGPMSNIGLAFLSMVGITTGGILNMILDPILINGFSMGTGGAAIATMASQTVSFSILFCFFLFGKSIVKINIKSVSRHFTDYKAIVTTGIPTIFRQGLASIASAALNIQAIDYGGDAAGAAITIANKVYMLVRNIIIGLGQGFQPAAGYNYGAGNKKRTWECFTFAVKVGTAICLTFGIFSALFAEEIMWFFCDDAEVALLGTQTLYFLCACIPLMAFSTFVNQLYQGLGFKLQATFLASCRQGIFFLPTVFIFPLLLDLTGVQATQSFADICTFFISIPFIIIFYKKYIVGKDSK